MPPFFVVKESICQVKALKRQSIFMQTGVFLGSLRTPYRRAFQPCEKLDTDSRLLKPE